MKVILTFVGHVEPGTCYSWAYKSRKGSRRRLLSLVGSAIPETAIPAAVQLPGSLLQVHLVVSVGLDGAGCPV